MGKQTLKHLAEELKTFAVERDWEQFHSPKNLAAALSVEAAEILEHFQWLTEEQSSSLSPEKAHKVKEEIADVLIYLVRLADRLEIEPLSAAYEKLEVNRKKYPISKAHGSAKKYTEL